MRVPGFTHVIPADERDDHEISVECLCAPRFIVKETGVRIDAAYYEHFAFDGREEERQVYQ